MELKSCKAKSASKTTKSDSESCYSGNFIKSLKRLELAFFLVISSEYRSNIVQTKFTNVRQTETKLCQTTQKRTLDNESFLITTFTSFVLPLQ